MTEDQAALDDLAAAVADGAAVDWAALTARAETPKDREQIARFALLARIAGVHADAGDEAGAALDGGLAPLPPYAPGDHWGPLGIVELLASGTFGTVYRAHDSTLARDVALKILHVPASGERLAVDAVAEGRLLARVRHPHVVSVYGADQYDGRVGLWMELVEGRTLEAELDAHGPLPLQDALAIGADLAQALHAVHAAGLLHRDLKTQNVMRDARDGRVVLMISALVAIRWTPARTVPGPPPSPGYPSTLPPRSSPARRHRHGRTCTASASSCSGSSPRAFPWRERRWPRSERRIAAASRSRWISPGPTYQFACHGSSRERCSPTRHSATRRSRRSSATFVWCVMEGVGGRAVPRAWRRLPS